MRIELGERPAGESSSESLSGVVVDEGGAPIEGAQVTAYLQQRGLHPSAQGTSGPDGRFEIDGLDSGPHMLIATHPAHPRARVRGARTGNQEIRITMTGGASVTGRVVDADGSPVPAFTIIARVARGPLVRRTVASVSSYDTEGRFELTGLSDGELELIATSRGYPPSEPVAVTLRGSASSLVTITLRRGGRIEGLVRSADGSPIEGATISLEGRLDGERSAVPLLARAVSSADGRYALEGIGELRSSVRVQADGYDSRILAGLAVRPGETQTLDVELTPVEEGAEARTELVGIGAVLLAQGDVLLIRRVVEGGGASGAGLERGDSVLAVDGTPVTALGFGGSIDRIRGQEGSVVVLRVRRRGAEEATDIAITRRRVRT